MSYTRLTPREREILDYIMQPENYNGARGLYGTLSDHFGVSAHRLKLAVKDIARAYQIYDDRFHLSGRLIYLRAKELGLLVGLGENLKMIMRHL